MKKSIIKIFLTIIITMLLFIFACHLPSDNGNKSSNKQNLQVLFTENFDKTAIDRIPDYWSADYWTADSTDDIYIGVVDKGVAPVSSPNCLKLWDFSSTASAGINRIIGDQNYGQLKYKVYLDSASEFRQATLFISNSNNNKIEFNINRSGTVSVKDQNGVRVNVGTCTLDSWHTVEAKWDRMTGYYRFYLDNTDHGAYPMLDSEIPNKIRIRSGNTDDPAQNSSIIYIDNVEFTINNITIGPVPISGFYENFESTDVGNIPGSWSLSYSPDGSECSAKVVDTSTIVPADGIHCMELIDKSTTNAAAIQKNINDQNYGQLKFSVYVRSGAKSSMGLFIYDSSNNNLIQLTISMYWNITIKNPDGTATTITFSGYPYDTWFTIEVKWDSTSGYYQVYVNNVNRGVYQLMTSGSPNKIKFRSGNVTDPLQNDSTIYIDDVIFNINNESINPYNSSSSFQTSSVSSTSSSSSSSFQTSSVSSTSSSSSSSFQTSSVSSTSSSSSSWDPTPDALNYITCREMVNVTGGTYDQYMLEGVVADSPAFFRHTISSFYIGKYNVTYELWYAVYHWAISNGYTFANAGREGTAGFTGTVPSDAKFEPVTTINWRDAIVWCNAYSEMSGLTPVYYTDSGFNTILKDSSDGSYGSSYNTTEGSFDNPYVNWSANGYRLPTEGEWQYAASNKGATPYNYLSGAAADYTNDTESQKVAWYGGSKTQNVGTKLPNQLGIFDMSGNVWELCWDWYDSCPGTEQTDYRGPATSNSKHPSRSMRGGGWYVPPGSCQIAIRADNIPYNEYSYIGIRLMRSTP